MRRLIRYGYVILVFLLLFSVVSIGAVIEYQRVVALEQKALEDNIRLVKSNIEQMITSRMINARGLVNILELADEMSYEEYEQFAQGIYESDNDIVKDVVLITDTTISYVYPEIYAKDAIGVDLALVEEQRDVILYSKETGDSVFIGPIDLVEGGVGLIIRVPFYIDDTYYGQSAIVFDYNNFVKHSGLSELANAHDVRLSGMDPYSGEQQLIWESSSIDISEPIIQHIDMENIRWTVEAAPNQGWNGTSSMFFFIISFGFLVSALISLLFMRQLSLKDKLISTNISLNNSVELLEDNRKELELHLIEIKDKEAYIRYLADHDSLTGLRNRRFFTEKIGQELSAKHSGAIILVDLDNFKHINDIHGHVYGDRLLKSCAKVISEGYGDHIKVYRFGGDEFLILINGDVDNAEIDAYLHSISERIEGQTIEGSMHHITMSIGIVQYPKDGMTVEDLLMKVDIAMYHAKYSGKNCHVYFNEEMFKDFNVRVDIENVLRDAVENDGFWCFINRL